MSFSLRPFALIFLFTLLLSGPAFFSGAVFGSDLLMTSSMARFFAQELWSGTLYPRWIPQMFAGHGSPVFFYYPPLSLYFTALFSPLGSIGQTYYFPLAASASLSLFLSGVTCFVWLSRTLPASSSHASAVFGALLYMAIPFHFTHNFYGLMMLSQCWAYVWFPLILLFARGSSFGLSISFALLFLTNIPNSLIAICVGAVWAMYGEDPLRRGLRHTAASGAVYVRSVLIASLLCAFYLLPAVMYEPFIMLHQSLQRLPALSELWHFGESPREHALAISQLIHYGLVALGVAWCVAVCRSALPVFFLPALFLTGLALFFQFPVSAWFWEHVPFFSLIQSPSRWMLAPTLMLAYLTCFCRISLVLRALLLFLLVFNTYFFASMKQMKEEDLFRDFPVAALRYQHAVDLYFGYLPHSDVAPHFYNPQAFTRLLSDNPMVQVLEGDAEVEILEWRARHIRLRIDAREASRVLVRQFYFPGWTAHTELGAPLALEAEDGRYRMILVAPPEKNAYEVSLDLQPLWPESLGRLISLVSLLFLLLFFLHSRKSSPCALNGF